MGLNDNNYNLHGFKIILCLITTGVLLCGCMDDGNSSGGEEQNNANIQKINIDNFDKYITHILQSSVGDVKLAGVSKVKGDVINTTVLKYNISGNSNSITMESSEKITKLLKNDGWTEKQITVANNGATLVYVKDNKQLTIASNTYVNYIVVSYSEINTQYEQQYINAVHNASSNAGTTAKSTTTTIAK
jgi:hypothetical protein